MTIAWNQISGNNPQVHYGMTDHRTNYTLYNNVNGVDRSISFRGMDNRFSRITGLLPNTSYYFVIRDSQDSSKRFWFKTAPDDTSRLSFIAGGDSRNNRTPRQRANTLVSKLKPHAVFFGGDMTSGDTDGQWQDWFDDWQLTTASDGRMFPIVAARGNHEYDEEVVYNLFDTPNQDSYYAITFGDNLIRCYTLNSEISVLGNQLNWLQNDLANSSANIWKMAQYHKPMRPHTANKSEGNDIYGAWAQLFYDEGVNLVVDCDSHMAKTTFPIKPSSGSNSEEGFEIDNEFGTVYTGEGSWGAPLRPNNDDKSWTRNSGSFNQFKLLFVGADKIELRTIKVDNALDVGENTNNNPFQLPSNLDVFTPSPGEDVIDILPKTTSSNAPITVTSQIDDDDDDAEESVSSGDVVLSSSDLEMPSDNGDQIVGMRFNNINVPQGVTVTNAFIQFTADESSSSSLDLTIKGELSSNASVFTTANNNISGRNSTSSSVIWSPNSWSDNDRTTDQRTVDISSIITEIVAQSGWQTGNSIVITITGSGSNNRRADSHDESSSDAAELVMTYQSTSITLTSQINENRDDAEERISNGSTGLGSSDLEMNFDGGSQQLVGLRFKNVGVPQGSTVSNAYVQFRAKGDEGGVVDLTIHAQDIGDAPEFTDDDNNISSRDITSSSVSWSPPDWSDNSNGVDQRTANLAPILNEVFARSDWSANNDVVIIISGSEDNNNIRNADSHNITTSDAPTLVVTYDTVDQCDPVASDNPDTDSDGISDVCDLDDDNDGILDTVEGGSDTDNDGIINSLDVDSDNDGCSDAIEGGANFDDSDTNSNDQLTGSVDADGVPTIATSSGQSVGSSQNAAVQDEDCTDECNAAASGNTDTDSDGVSDICDLDDDNDGILDTDESGGIDIITPFGFENGETVSPSETQNDPENNWESDFDFSGTHVDYIIRSPDYVSDALASPWYDVIEGVSFASIQTANNTPKSSDNDGLGFSFTASELSALNIQPGGNINFSLRYAPGFNYQRLDQGGRPADDDTALAVWYGNGTITDFASLPTNPSIQYITGAWNPSGSLATIGGPLYPVQNPNDWQTANITFSYTGGDIYIAFSALLGATNPSGRPENIFLDNIIIISSTDSLDTDGDGFIDGLDLDSDNDGCSDVNEYYNNPSADGGDGGDFGIGIPSVDANGLVIGAGYDGTGLANALNSAISSGCDPYIYGTPGNWQTDDHWSFGRVPTALDIVIVRADVSVITPQELSKLTVDPTFTVDIDTGQTLEITGNIENNGSFIGRGEVVLDGTLAQVISGGGSFENLRLENPTNVDFTDPADLFGVVYVDQGTLNTNGNLSLRCNFGTPAKTAQVAPVFGTINGVVTVEQCYPARRAFRFISPSVSTTSTIRANWQEGADSYTDNPITEFGTHITGVEPGPANATEDQDGNDGFDYNPSGNASMFTFDNVGRSWNSISGTDVTLAVGTPYRLMIRGDRGIDVRFNASVPTDTRLRATGELVIGTSTQSSLGSNNVNFIGNPYQAQVDMNALISGSSNISPAQYYVWDPTLGGVPTVGESGGRGAYVTVDLPSGSNSSSSSANTYLQPMQAAFVTTTGTASVTFQEVMKAVGEIQTDVKSQIQSEYINIQLFDANSFAQGATPSDGLRINFDNSFSITTEDDSPKLSNLDENLARLSENTAIAIERRPFPEATEELPLFMNQYRRESYVMKFEVTDNLTAQIFVKDNYLETLTEITSSDNTFSFTIEFSIPESEASDRFSLVFEPESLSTGDINLVSLSLYPNPTQGSFRISGMDLGQDTQVEIYTMIGQQVYTANSKGQSTLEITDFKGATGVYLVKLNTNQGEKTFKLLKD
jgi:hypothetical protein